MGLFTANYPTKLWSRDRCCSQPSLGSRPGNIVPLPGTHACLWIRVACLTRCVYAWVRNVDSIPVPVLDENSVTVLQKKPDLALRYRTSAPMILFEDKPIAFKKADVCVVSARNAS